MADLLSWAMSPWIPTADRWGHNWRYRETETFGKENHYKITHFIDGFRKKECPHFGTDKHNCWWPTLTWRVPSAMLNIANQQEYTWIAWDCWEQPLVSSSLMLPPPKEQCASQTHREHSADEQSNTNLSILIYGFFKGAELACSLEISFAVPL